MSHPQPYFKIIVQGIDSYWSDVSPYVSAGVTYSEAADTTRSLNFTIDKYAEQYLKLIRVGMQVTFSGGYRSEEGRFIYQKLFHGHIRKIGTRFAEDGTSSLTFTCFSLEWLKLTQKSFSGMSYPQTLGGRTFTQRDSMKLSDIVLGVIKENGLNGEVFIKPDLDVTYNITKAFQSQFKTDWLLLRQLAKRARCTVWTEYGDSGEVVYFQPISFVQDGGPQKERYSQKVSFLYPRRTVKQVAGSNNLYDDRAFETKTMTEGTILLDSVSIDEDLADSGSVSYSGSTMDLGTGEDTITFASTEIRNGRKALIYYELNSERVDEVTRTDPARAERIRSMNPTSIPWEQAKEFFREKVMYDDEEGVAMYDGALFGVTIQATCKGDLRIKSQRAYPVIGVNRYSSDKGESNKKSYWLQELSHTWDTQGFKTELTFKY